MLIGESGPTLERAFRAAGLAGTERAADLDEAVAAPTPSPGDAARDAAERDGRRTRPRVLLSPAAASFDMFVDYAARGRAFKTAVAALAADPHREERPMNLAPPIPRLERPRRDRPGPADGRATANRTPAKSRAGRVRRERHQADYVILVVVVALTAIGILMVYSSSALKGYLSQDADTFATVGPQIQWAILGLLAMAAMMRVDYRYLRLASVPFYSSRSCCSSSCFVPQSQHRRRRLGALAQARAAAGGPPGGDRQARAGHLPRPLVRQAGRAGPRLLGRTVPFLIIVAPVIVLVFKEPDLGTTGVITLTAFTMFFVAGANLVHLAVMVAALAALARDRVGLRGYQMDRIRAWHNPWLDPLGAGFHTVQGLLALGVGGLFGTGLGESQRLRCPNAFNDFIFAEVGQEFGLLGGDRRHRLFLLLAYSGVRVALAAPDTFGALLAAGITAWLCLQAFINIGVVVALLPITGITLPFISAGGSSLIISFAAVGILLSISRETVEKGTWNDDAIADRGGRDGRTHLPGARRRPVAPRAALTRPSCAGWAATAASRRPSSRRPASPCAVSPRARCARPRPTSTPSSTRSGSALSVPQATAILARERPAAIFTTGGYVAVPVLMAAAPLGIPVVHVGRQRHPRPCGPGDGPPGRRAGRLVRGDLPGAGRRRARPPVLRHRHADPRHRARSTGWRPGSALDMRADERVLLIFGGSQAVRRFNAAVAEALPRPGRAGDGHPCHRRRRLRGRAGRARGAARRPSRPLPAIPVPARRDAGRAGGRGPGRRAGRILDAGRGDRAGAADGRRPVPARGRSPAGQRARAWSRPVPRG